MVYSRIWVALAVTLALSSSIANAGGKRELSVAGRSITWNGKTFVLPSSKSDVLAALGKPDRVRSPGANDVLIWDSFGLYAYARPGSDTVHGLAVIFGDLRKHSDFPPDRSFDGTLVVDGAKLTPDLSFAAINKARKQYLFSMSYAKYAWSAEGDGFIYFLQRGNADRFTEDGPIMEFSVGATERRDQTEEIEKTLAEAGFNDKGSWNRHLEAFTRFGSRKAYDQYLRGDAFDRIEVTKASKEHREKLRFRRFTVSLKFRPLVLDDIETRGLVARIDLPLRVRGKEPFFDDTKGFSGVLAELHPSEADTLRLAFLTKNGTVQYCTQAEAAEVRRNKGVLYFAEQANTNLVLIFKDKLDLLKEISRNSTDYRVEMDFCEVCYERPLAWGLFRTDTFLAANWDSQKIWLDYLLDDKNPQPVYFPTAIEKENEAKIPELVRATVDSLRIVDRTGTVIGGWYVERASKRDAKSKD